MLDTDPPCGSVHDILHEFLSGASQRPGTPFVDPVKTLDFETKSARKRFRHASLRPGFKTLKISQVASKDCVWALSTTRNQIESVEPVATLMPETGPVGMTHLQALHPHDFWGPSLSRTALRYLQQAQSDLAALPKDLLAHVADLPGLYALCLAEAKLFERAVTRIKPAALLLTNDHSPRNRAVLSGARVVGLPIAYLQHAAVGGIERPLDMDLALLQGRHSLEVYRKIGPVTAQVELIGSPKIDKARRQRSVSSGSPRSIILFPGLFDKPQTVSDVGLELAACFPDAAVGIRPHPRDMRGDWETSVVEPIKRTSRSESAMDALARCDLAVFDDSNIGLEAAALGVPVLCVPFGNGAVDQYGLSTTGIFDACKANPGDVCRIATEVIDGQRSPEASALDYIFEGWSKGAADADVKAAHLLSDFAQAASARKTR